MISERTKALLSAAATIYAQALVSDTHKDRDGESLRAGSVEAAYRMLEAIEAREKANLSPREAK